MTRRKPKPVPAGPNPADTPPADIHPVGVEPAADIHGPVDHPTVDPRVGSLHAAEVRPDGPRVPNPFGHRQDAVAGVRLLEDRRFKQVQLKFAEKPSDAVRQVVADAGWRWRAAEEHWTRQIDPERGWQTRAEAEELFDRVAAMLRAEKGVTHEHA